jgi:hypothetical protein
VPPPRVTGDQAAPQVPPTPHGTVWATLLRSDRRVPAPAWLSQAHTTLWRLAQSSPREHLLAQHSPACAGQHPLVPGTSDGRKAGRAMPSGSRRLPSIPGCDGFAPCGTRTTGAYARLVNRRLKQLDALRHHLTSRRCAEADVAPVAEATVAAVDRRQARTAIAHSGRGWGAR